MMKQNQTANGEKRQNGRKQVQLYYSYSRIDGWFESSGPPVEQIHLSNIVDCLSNIVDCLSNMFDRRKILLTSGL